MAMTASARGPGASLLHQWMVRASISRPSHTPGDRPIQARWGGFGFVDHSGGRVADVATLERTSAPVNPACVDARLDLRRRRRASPDRRNRWAGSISTTGAGACTATARRSRAYPSSRVFSLGCDASSSAGLSARSFRASGCLPAASACATVAWSGWAARPTPRRGLRSVRELADRAFELLEIRALDDRQHAGR